MKAIDFTKDIILENERVLLRPLTPEDVIHLMPFAMNEPDLWTYSHVPASGKENMHKYMELAFTKKKKCDSYPWIVFDKKLNKYAGSTRFYDYHETDRTVQLGYTWYGKEFWGTGLNKNCKYLMLSYAFEELGLLRVEFRADNKNARSIAAMKGLGCTEEGVLRSTCANTTGGRRDSIILSILADEWYGGLNEELLNRIAISNQ